MHKIATAALATTATAVATGALLAPGGQAAPAKTETLRLYEKTRTMQLTRADGTVHRKVPLPEPRPGDVLDVVFDLHRGDHRNHGKARIGSDHLRCTFGEAGPPSCISHATLGSSMLVVTGTPARIVLGTGRYLGATGRVVSAREVKGVPPSDIRHNDIDVVVQVRRAAR
ncbi:hypothetical protein [Conexibacter sp. SYSU D00693]|uniref:hypothetical protein n=1 Tax=Conexibacter sp. SYSU D00693 TaxID=2812560 RepID=UPI00196B9CC9|nr:hypothetical protein [Conexibacter sp. SYSU D00693]